MASIVQSAAPCHPTKVSKFKILTNFQFGRSKQNLKKYSCVSNITSRLLVKKSHGLNTAYQLRTQQRHIENKGQINLHERWYSKERLVWEEDGETLIRSPFNEVSVPKASFAEFMFSKLDEYKHLNSVVDHLTNRTYTGAQIKETTIKIASALVKKGYKKGDVILILATNCPEYSMVFMACSAVGVVVSTANPIYTPGELARQLGHCEAKGVFTMVSMVGTVKEALKQDQDVAQNIKDVFTLDGEADKCQPLKNLLEDDGKSFPENVDFDLENDIATLPYSSGTTGFPKGVMLTHYNIVANLQQSIGGPMKLRPDEDVLLGLLPFYHIYGLVVVQFGALSQGARLITLPKFDPMTFLESIQKQKMTYMHIVPPLALFLAKQPLVEKFDLSSLETLVTAAAPLGGHVQSEVEQRLNCNFVQAYGLTETSPISHYDQPPSTKGTIGHLVPNTLAKIVCPMSGKVCGVGEEGEVVMKGPQVMKGYLKNQKATDGCITDGWFFSGDIGHVNEKGYFTITDRLKELIKYKGFQVAPAELEALLCTHPSVQDAAVVGLKVDESVGEVPKAFVVLKPDTDIKTTEIEDFVERNVAAYKKLRGGVEVVSSIPKTASGKILRRVLRDQAN